MTDLNSGEVGMTLDGKNVVLKPSLQAAMAINNAFGGFLAALDRIGRLDLSAQTLVVKVGLGLRDSHAGGLDERVFREGAQNLVAPLSRYVSLLANGGKEPAKDDDRAGEGNE